MRWENPSPDDEKYGYDNYGIGWDLEAGEDATIPDVTWLDPEEEEEGEEDEEEDDDDGMEGEWWWLIKDLREFAASPQVYVRIPLVGDMALEASYVAVREKRPLVGGLDVMLMFYFPK